MDTSPRKISALFQFYLVPFEGFRNIFVVDHNVRIKNPRIAKCIFIVYFC